MKNKKMLFLLPISLALGLFFIGDQWTLNKQEKTSASEVRSKESAESKLVPGDWFFQQRAYPHGTIDKQAFVAARRTRAKLVQEQATQSPNRFNSTWDFAGPTNIGGRVTDIEMPASSLEIIYVGTASGGIFKSSDQGNSWTPIFEDALSLAIGDMAIAPSDENTLYVGTGEANGGGGSLAYDGLGVYKSTDAGDTWKFSGLEEVGSIGKVVVDPTDPNKVLVAAMGDLFGASDDRGVYRSLDGGENWEQVLFVSDITGAIDLAIHPENPSILYAAMWERTRTPQNNTYGGATSGIYQSVDGGNTWKELTNGLPNTPAEKGRIGLAIAPSLPNEINAFYANTAGFIEGIFKSKDDGATWETLSASGIYEVPYMWWFGKIVIHPTEPEQIYVAGFDAERSMDGGTNWETVFSGAHVDQHSLFIHPANPDMVLAGNDGGVYLSFNGGENYDKINGLPITQFYTCEIDESNPELIYGGTQDNSTMRTKNGALDDWEIIYVGDGFYTLVDPNDNTIIYTEYQYGNFAKSTDGGNIFFAATTGISPSDRANWNTPVVFDPTNSSTLYLGTNHLYESTNQADSWTPISPDLSNGPGGGTQVFGTITAISVSPVDPNILYAGTDDGNVWRTFNKGDTWTKISDDLPNRWVTSIASHPSDPAIAFVTFSGYRYHSDLAHVFKTFDNGTNWIDISGNLPDVPVNKILSLSDPEVEVLATDIGVFRSSASQDNWELLGQGLPNVVVTDLDYYEPTQKLLAATYGRSMFTYTLDLEVGISAQKAATFEASIFPNPSTGNSQLLFTPKERGLHQVDLFTANGILIQRLLEQDLEETEITISLSGLDLPSGLYWFKGKSAHFQFSQKWLLVK